MHTVPIDAKHAAGTVARRFTAPRRADTILLAASSPAAGEAKSASDLRGALVAWQGKMLKHWGKAFLRHLASTTWSHDFDVDALAVSWVALKELESSYHIGFI